MIFRLNNTQEANKFSSKHKSSFPLSFHLKAKQHHLYFYVVSILSWMMFLFLDMYGFNSLLFRPKDIGELMKVHFFPNKVVSKEVCEKLLVTQNLFYRRVSGENGGRNCDA